MPLDLSAYARAAEAANALIAEHGAIGDAEAIERLAEDFWAAQLGDTLEALIVSELRTRAEFIRAAVDR